MSAFDLMDVHAASSMSDGGGTVDGIQEGSEEFDQAVEAVFKFIDKDDDGELTKEEFRRWFDKSTLVDLMLFKEFYAPIQKVDMGTGRKVAVFTG